MGKPPIDVARVELGKLAAKCHHKRTALYDAANRRAQRRKMLHFTAGILALMSGGSITAVITVYANSTGMKVVSAVLAFVSGSITLLLDGFYDVSETQQMFSGASKFMLIRERIDIERRRPTLTDAKAFDRLSKFAAEYAEISQRYESYTRHKLWHTHNEDNFDTVREPES